MNDTDDVSVSLDTGFKDVLSLQTFQGRAKMVPRVPFQGAGTSVRRVRQPTYVGQPYEKLTREARQKRRKEMSMPITRRESPACSSIFLVPPSRISSRLSRRATAGPATSYIYPCKLIVIGHYARGAHIVLLGRSKIALTFATFHQRSFVNHTRGKRCASCSSTCPINYEYDVELNCNTVVPYSESRSYAYYAPLCRTIFVLYAYAGRVKAVAWVRLPCGTARLRIGQLFERQSNRDWIYLGYDPNHRWIGNSQFRVLTLKSIASEESFDDR